MPATCLHSSKIPLLENTPPHKPLSSNFNRHLETLQKCLDAIFHSKIIEARKYIPSVMKDLKTGVLAHVLVPELVERFLQFSALLSSEQFDLVVKLLNSALIDSQSALLLLPLTTIIYRVSAWHNHPSSEISISPLRGGLTCVHESLQVQCIDVLAIT